MQMIRPTPENIKTARANAGDTQSFAAARVNSPSHRTWQDWESGARVMPLSAWELYLIKTGQSDEAFIRTP